MKRSNLTEPDCERLMRLRRNGGILCTTDLMRREYGSLHAFVVSEVEGEYSLRSSRLLAGQIEIVRGR